MTIDPTNAGSAGLVDRAKNILLKPQTEWDKIAGEPVDVQKLYIGYVLPLAILAGVCGFIGASLIGGSFMGVAYKTPLVAGLVTALLQICLAVASVYVVALIINALAPNFGSQQDVGQAHKLAAYGSTANLVGGVLAILPALAPLGIIAGIYSLVLIYIGLPRLMKTPEDKRIIYLLAILGVWIVVAIVIGVVLGAVGAVFGVGRGMMSY